MTVYKNSNTGNPARVTFRASKTSSGVRASASALSQTRGGKARTAKPAAKRAGRKA